MSKACDSSGNEERFERIWVLELPMDVSLDSEDDGVNKCQAEERRGDTGVEAHGLQSK